MSSPPSSSQQTARGSSNIFRDVFKPRRSIEEQLGLSSGAYRPRLARLKYSLDPHNVLVYACRLPKAPREQKLIILVTGESCAGKDYCADIWVSVFATYAHKSLRARAVSIINAIKQEYAAATGADLNCLLWDRAYKEQHRPALTHFSRTRYDTDLSCQRSIF
ncbi:hypothetical protein BGZ61DRAFT_541837 [Ilyonectria robusta]|uniref:uncharacterized protein n=1 Tax=Ilyonectria robusta TaxID=1079257 RepID=UPI001E8E4FBF|nr:uncharacterized protein BGZ61DRAFT_541837 [Ilyonectria robusta]KAH8652826.1 hypothetical protein BGZ61DRAFT_541837 [Ilyonectria robusta]